MKILKLGDLHFGVKQDSVWMQNIQRLAIENAIKYSKENGITKWIQTGDWFDVRKAITHKTMEFTREIAQKIMAAGIEVDVIVGNHDMAMKQKIHPNACNELLSQFPNFTVYNNIQTVDYDGCKIDLCPWICEENKDEILQHINSTKAKYCIGHFELSGFYFYKGMKSNGEDPAFLRKYDQVWSGHFHTISENRNIKFIGTPYSITSGDENDPRGFWIFDTDTKESEFIQNPVMWHQRIDYPCTINFNAFKGLSVRVFVSKMDDKFAKFETELESVVHEMKVIVNVEKADNNEENDCIVAPVVVKSMHEIITDYIETIPDLTDVEKEKTNKLALSLYNDCN